jgi:acyl-CoA dehydrogenase
VINECIPAETIYDEELQSNGPVGRWTKIPLIMTTLQTRAKQLGLWNLFLTTKYATFGGLGLTVSEYGLICEELGRSFLAPEACNCSAPDTGNMEVLIKYASPAQRDKWLGGLLDGSSRSAFAMTERDVASSDARGICTGIVRRGDGMLVIDGRKW